MPIKQGFLKVLIVVSLMGFVLNQAGPLIINNYSALLKGIQIQLEKEALFLPSVQKQLTQFYQFKTLHDKQYINPQEEVFRSIVYTKNLDKINKNNQKVNRKYNMALNKFTDLTPLEFTQLFTNLYKSNEKVKDYTQKLLKEQNFYDSTNTHSLNQTDFIRKNQQHFNAVRDYVMSYINSIKENVMRQSHQFKLVEDIFSNATPINQVREAKNQQLKNYFDSHQLPSIQINLPSGVNLQFPKGDGMYNQIQRQFDKIFLPTPITPTASRSIPLKSTNDSSSPTFGPKLILNSTSGNFSNSVIDWTQHAGKIRYQGVCGACYTFATSDTVGSLYSIYKFGFFVALSTQQVVDCSTNGLTYGCNGGFLEGSYAYMQIKGIQSEDNYPYTSAVSGETGTCKKSGGSFKVASFKNIEEGNCKALVNQLNYGPVSIGIAGYRLQFYSSGIFNDCNSYIDHAVVLIAYKSGVGWKIKNSWGPDWGMNGFAWIADGNNCGICNMGVAARI